MWQALRAELAYSGPWLAGALGIASGVVALLAAIFHAVGSDGPDAHAAAGMRGMFAVMAPIIVAYIIQGLRLEEHRSRLLLAGPLSPRHLAAVSLMLPIAFAAVGIIASVALMAVEAAITNRLELESIHFAGYVGGMMFMMAFVALLIQEAVAAFRQGRRKASLAAWAIFVAAVVAFAAATGGVVVYQGDNSWPTLHLLNVIIGLAAIAGTYMLYTRRTDFTT